MPKQMFSVRLDKDLIKRLKRAAEQKGRSVTNMLEWILKLFFKLKK